MDIAQFRLDFPEFADETRYPDAMITFWSGVGEKLISEERFGGSFVYALSLFTAHNISLQAAAVASSTGGASPGSAGGSVSSKTVGSVSVSYDTSASMEPNAGHWNQTFYGRQYISVVRMFGQGCYQL